MKNQQALELDEEIFNKLFAFFNDDNLSNPYRIITNNGKWMELYIENSYDYVQENNYIKYVVNKNIE